MADTANVSVRTFHFVTSAQVALDARTLMNARLIWLQLVSGIIILLIGVALAVGGFPSKGSCTPNETRRLT